MIKHLLCGTLMVAGLAACEPVPNSTNPNPATPAVASAPAPAATASTLSAQDQANVAASAQVLANVLNDTIPEGLGDGVRRRDARAEGTVLYTGYNFPFRANEVRQSQVQSLRFAIRSAIRRDLCSADILNSFLLVGGEMVVELGGRNGRIIDSFRFDSC